MGHVCNSLGHNQPRLKLEENQVANQIDRIVQSCVIDSTLPTANIAPFTPPLCPDWVSSEASARRSAQCARLQRWQICNAGAGVEPGLLTALLNLPGQQCWIRIAADCSHSAGQPD